MVERGVDGGAAQPTDLTGDGGAGIERWASGSGKRVVRKCLGDEVGRVAGMDQGKAWARIGAAEGHQGSVIIEIATHADAVGLAGGVAIIIIEDGRTGGR